MALGRDINNVVRSWFSTDTDSRLLVRLVDSAGADADAATAAKQDTGNGSLATIATATGTKVTASPALGAGGVGIIGWLSNAVDKLISLGLQLPVSLGIKNAAGSVSTAPASDAVWTVGGTTTNPTSVLTRPADTNAYAANDLVASSTTAVSIVVPSITVMRLAAGSASIPKINLLSNHTTGLSGVSVAVRLWSAAPTYTNGDNGAYVVTTGAATYLGKYTGSFEQFTDGAAAELVPVAGTFGAFKLASGQVVYWDLQALTAFTPQSGMTFTAIPQCMQD